jgi:hypothetical protein
MKKGTYHTETFEPYTFKYACFFAKGGNIKVNGMHVIFFGANKPNKNIVLNDVKNRNISHYDKKYGYGYFSDDNKPKKGIELFKWFKKFT